MATDLKSRFMTKVRVNDGTGCWEWIASKRSGGYGQIMVGSGPKRAHRVSYELYCGEIPRGLHVLHRCDNRACVNPSHLFLGTNADNQADMDAKGRRVLNVSKGENNGSAKLTEDDVVAIRSAEGVPHLELASKFGISRRHVHTILSGRAWKNVQEGRCQKLADR